MYRVYTITIYDIRKYTIRIYTTTALTATMFAQCFAYFQIINLRILKWLILSASALQWVSIAL